MRTAQKQACHSLAQKQLKRKGNFWILDADICNYAGACRFYVGLAKEIKVIDSPEFEEYVRGYVQKNLLKKSSDHADD